MTDREGFVLNADTALLFFRFCRRYQIERYDDRLSLIRAMVKRNKAKYLRDVKPFLNGKKVLTIEAKNENL